MQEKQIDCAVTDPGHPVESVGWLDAAAFSGAIAASVAGAITWAVSLALVIPPRISTIGLAICGTSVVYSVDRLRDLERDRHTAPLRSYFVDRYQAPLRVFAALCALASTVLAWQLGPPVWILCSIVLIVGLFHRRLKVNRSFKRIYVSLAWSAIVVGLPVLSSSPAVAGDRVAWVLAIVGCGFLSNLFASNMDWRSLEPPARRNLFAISTALAPSTVLALIGIGFAFFAPGPIGALGLVPAVELIAVSGFRPGERYGPIVVDGALTLGAATAIVVIGL